MSTRLSAGSRVGRALILGIWLGLALVGAVTIQRALDLAEAWESHRTATRIAWEVTEDPFVAYDPELGWAQIPGARHDASALFGEGSLVEIGPQGFRGSRSFAASPPPGRLRVIALGDSFTFGPGPEQESWPAQLEAMEPRLEVVNMGSNGYGIDQMYLWYRRVAPDVEHGIVITALIQGDFERALEHKWVSGYGRPRFVIKRGALTLTNVPVPPRVPPGRRNDHAADFGQFLASQTGLLRPTASELARPDGVPLRLLTALRQSVADQGASFGVLFLPIADDLSGEVPFRGAVARFCAGERIRFLDLTETFRAQPDHAGLFNVDGHYSARGYRLVAEAARTMVDALEASARAAPSRDATSTKALSPRIP